MSCERHRSPAFLREAGDRRIGCTVLRDLTFQLSPDRSGRIFRAVHLHIEVLRPQQDLLQQLAILIRRTPRGGLPRARGGQEHRDAAANPGGRLVNVGSSRGKPYVGHRQLPAGLSTG